MAIRRSQESTSFRGGVGCEPLYPYDARCLTRVGLQQLFGVLAERGGNLRATHHARQFLAAPRGVQLVNASYCAAILFLLFHSYVVMREAGNLGLVCNTEHLPIGCERP